MQCVRAQVVKNEVLNAGGAGEWFLVHFIHRYLDFRVPDFESVANYFGVPTTELTWRMPYGNEFMSPYWHVKLRSEEMAFNISERSMLTRGLFEVWGEGGTWEELQSSVEAYPESKKAPWLTEDKSFKVEVSPFGSRLNHNEILRAVEKMRFIEAKGKVSMKDPDVCFWLIICQTGAETVQGLNDGDAPSVSSASSNVDPDSAPLPSLPFRMYFAREISVSDRSRVRSYRLNARKYLGPTSMDVEMAFLMCNAALAGPKQLVYEPYAGTGSIMVALAHHGAQVMGSDIDIRVICAGKTDSKGNSVTVRSNFEQYNLQSRLADLIRMDAHRHPFRLDLEEIFHSVVGDPPYGVRAGGRKTCEGKTDMQIQNVATHIPSTDPYNMGECLRDLLDLSARMMVIGGRLVYFFPASLAKYSPDEIPQHPALEMLYNIPQVLSSRYCRRLIVMQKVKKYDAEEAAKYHEKMGEPILSVDNLHEEVYEPRSKDDKKKKKVEKYRGKTV
eukprot:gene4995-34779_t